MRKLWFLVGTILLLLPILTLGCGVAQEAYDAVVAERDSLAAGLQSVQSELDATKSKLESIQSELEGMNIELKSITGELDTAKSEVESAQSELTAKESDLQSVRSELETVKSELEAALAELIEAKAPVTPTPPAVEGQTYRNSEYGFSCDFPEGWIVDEGVGVTVMFAGPLDGEYDYMVNINVLVTELPIKWQLDELVRMSDLQTKQQWPSYTVVQMYETTISGVPAIVQVYTVEATDTMGYPFKNATATLLKDKVAYQITLDVTTDLYEKYRDEFILVTNTFKLE